MAWTSPSAATSIRSLSSAVGSPAFKSDRGKFDRLVILLEGPIDLDLVARLILGRHWRNASGKQRAEYLDLFRAYALDNLASKLHLYQGEQFDITDQVSYSMIGV